MKVIKYKALTTEHYDPVPSKGSTEEDQDSRCLSCGSCRDCHLCETMCPTGVIHCQDVAPGKDGVDYEYVPDDYKGIACGFCADTCPCGIWSMRPF